MRCMHSLQHTSCMYTTLLLCTIMITFLAGMRKGPLSMGDNSEFSIQSEDFPALPGFKGAYTTQPSSPYCALIPLACAYPSSVRACP